MFGIDTVTPETEVSSSGGDPIKIGDIDTGLALHGANLIPIKLDIGIQNFPASDFAAWPNPVTLANNGAALLFPTYIIRGFDEDAVEDSLEDQLSTSFRASCRLPQAVVVQLLSDGAHQRRTGA